MELRIRALARTPVVEVAGKVYLRDATILRDTILSLFENGSRQLIINMDGVIYLDSAGLSALIILHRRALECQSHYCLCSSNTLIEQLLNVTGLKKIIPLTQTEQEAIRHLKAVG